MPDPQRDMATLRVERLGADDLHDVITLEESAFSSAGSLEQYTRLLDSGVCCLMGIKEPQQLCAYIAAVLVPAAKELEIYNIAVDKTYRRQGYAAALLAAVLRAAASAGAERAVLEVREGNRAAIKLYESQGFTLCGRRRRYYVQPVEDALMYEKVFFLGVS